MPPRSQPPDAAQQFRFWIQPDSTKLEYEGLKICKAHPQHESDVMDDDVGAFGRGLAFYRGDTYLGYHMLSPPIARMPLEKIVETREFLNIYQHFNRRR